MKKYLKSSQRHGSNLLAFIVCSLLLAACTPHSSTRTTAPAANTPSPTTNFYQWANHDWLRDTPIPADRPGINNFIAIQKQVSEELIRLLDGIPTDSGHTGPEQQLATLYAAYLDMSQRNAKGLSPIAPELLQIDRARHHADIAVLFARLQKIGVQSPVVYAAATDFKNSDRHIVFVGQAGLGIERDSYTANDERSQKERQLYRNIITELFTLAGMTDAAQQAEQVLQLETGLAGMQWSRADNRDIGKIYNVTDFHTLKSKASHLHIDRQMAELGMPTQYPFNIMQPDYLSAFNDYFTRQSVSAWQSYLKAQLLLSYASLLDQRFKAAVVNYEIQRGMYGTEQPMPQQAVDYLNRNVGMLLGEIYVKTYFDEGVKEQIEAIIENIVAEYRIAIEQSPRMSATTKTKALEKLNSITFKIGYPDQWRDYSSLRILPGELAENHKRIQLHEQQRNVAKLGHPVDRNDWDHPPQEVNAFYDPTSNSFVLLAGILHPPFFSAGGSDAEHYGGIGFVVGHEIGHGFDDQGSRFDARGNLANWWTPEDAQAFDKIRTALIAQANAYEILPGVRLKGELEIGEIIGDLSGAEISLRAYQKIVAAKNLDAEQAYRDFFLQLATTWRDKLRDDFRRLLIEADPHPPSEFRANGIVKNFDAFHATFATQPGDPMYLPPAERVRMW